LVCFVKKLTIKIKTWERPNNDEYSMYMTSKDYLECETTLLFRTTRGLTLMDMLDIVEDL
jgi:hypothetical protein